MTVVVVLLMLGVEAAAEGKTLFHRLEAAKAAVSAEPVESVLADGSARTRRHRAGPARQVCGVVLVVNPVYVIDWKRN